MSLTDELKSTIDEMRSITDELRKWFDTNRIHWFGRRPEIEPMLDRIDAELAERYVKLPVDADDMPIHIGDVMEVINGGLKAEACYMQIGPSGIWSVGLTKRCHWYDTESLRHYHAPTVEDVLEEFAQMYIACNDKGTIAEYAAKLMLKENE